MKNLLVVIDMQNDFITGSLGSYAAQRIVDKVADKIIKWDGDIITTRDYHFSDYLDTQEGKKLPIPHCIDGTMGAELEAKIQMALLPYFTGDRHICTAYKNGFGSPELPYKIGIPCKYNSITLVGLCTDICVIANALILKSFFPEITIEVDAFCCAGTSMKAHEQALNAMKMCQIDIINEVGE